MESIKSKKSIKPDIKPNINVASIDDGINLKFIPKNIQYECLEADSQIVAISTNNTNHCNFSNCTDSKIKSLLAEFISNGYRAVCLTTKQETSIVDFIYITYKNHISSKRVYKI